MPLIIRIQRQHLSDALSECHPFLPEKSLKKPSHSWLNKVSSALWSFSPDVAEIHSEIPWWIESVSRLIEAGTPDSFLNAEDIFQLFILLKELKEITHPPEKTFCNLIIPHYEVLTELSFWDFISALDDAWVFRFQRKPSTDSFINVDSSPDITPPPEEDTCGQERFIRLISLDTEIISRIVISGHVLLQSDYENYCPSGKLGMLTDKLIAQSTEPQDDLKEYPCSEMTVPVSTEDSPINTISAEPLTIQQMTSLPFSFLLNSKMTPIKKSTHFHLGFFPIIGLMSAKAPYSHSFPYSTNASLSPRDNSISDDHKKSLAISSPSYK